MDLTVAIISYNTKDLLRACLESICGSGSSLDYEVIIVDNKSTDGSAEMVKTDFPGIRLIVNLENAGFARAANQALEAGTAPYTLILNGDTEVAEGCFDALHSFMTVHKDAAVAGPLILNPDGSMQFSCRNFPSFPDATAHAFLGTIWPENPFSKRYKKVGCDRDTEQEVDWVSGAAMCLRGEAVKAIDFFDEGYHMYVEDMDLCYRLWKANWRVFYVPSAKVFHHIGQSSKQASTSMIIEHQKSIYRFYSKLYEDKPWRHLKLLIGLGLYIRAAQLILMNRIRKKEGGKG